MAIRIVFKHISFVILLFVNRFVQLLSTGLSLLHNMITHNVAFVKKRAQRHASNCFPFESHTLADDEIDNKTIFMKN